MRTEPLVVKQIIGHLFGFHCSLMEITGTDYHGITISEPYGTVLPWETVELALTIQIVQNLHGITEYVHIPAVTVTGGVWLRFAVINRDCERDHDQPHQQGSV